MRHGRVRRSCRASRDIYAALPAITGKIELEYEGELVGGHAIARELIRRAADATFQERAGGVNTDDIVMWFDEGGALQVTDDVALRRDGRGLRARSGAARGRARQRARARATMRRVVAAACELVLEALVARKKISRSDDGPVRSRAASRAAPAESGSVRRRHDGVIEHPASDQHQSLEADARLDAGLTVRASHDGGSRRRGRASARAASRAFGESDLPPAASRCAGAREPALRGAAAQPERGDLPRGERRRLAVGILRCVASAGLPLLFPVAPRLHLVGVRRAERTATRRAARALHRGHRLVPRARTCARLGLHNAVENETANAVWDALGFRVVEHLRVCHLS